MVDSEKSDGKGHAAITETSGSETGSTSPVADRPVMVRNRTMSDKTGTQTFTDYMTANFSLHDNSSKAAYRAHEAMHAYLPISNKVVLCDYEELEQKKVYEEIRARKDLIAFAEDTRHFKVFLDLREKSVNDIVQTMLKAMLADTEDGVDITEPRDELVISAKQALLGPKHKGAAKCDDDNRHWERSIQGPNYLLALGDVLGLQKRLIGLAILHRPTNLGTWNEDLTQFVVIILGPSVEVKETKSVFETGRTFASLLSDISFFHETKNASDENEVREAMIEYVEYQQKLADFTAQEQERLLAFRSKGLKAKDVSAMAAGEIPASLKQLTEEDRNFFGGSQRTKRKWTEYLSKIPGRGIARDFMRRKPHYFSDWTDGLGDGHSLRTYLSTIVFFFFAIILPSVAFGTINNKNTDGDIGVLETLASQAMCGMLYSVFAGQPLTIIMTTGPITVYIEVLSSWTESLDVDFLPFYAWTGLWTALFLILIAVFDISSFIRYCGAFTEEIFAMLISAIFIGEFVKMIVDSANADPQDVILLQFTLAFLTYYIARQLLLIRRSFLLRPLVRTILSDFGAPFAVLVMSGFAAIFNDIEVPKLEVPGGVGLQTSSGRSWIVNIFSINVEHIFLALIPGLLLTTLFFLDQNISSILVNDPNNKLLKGNAYHLDMLCIGCMVALCSILGIPWVHAALPHSPMHARALAEVEEYQMHGRECSRVVFARETRHTAFWANLFIGIVLLCGRDILKLIPQAVTTGFLLYMGVTSLDGNQLWERTLLYFTQQEKFPPNHYVRRVPLRTIHLFTAVQLVCLVVLWFVKANFYIPGDPVMNTGLLFPMVIGLFIPLRLSVLPKYFSEKDLFWLIGDGHGTPEGLEFPFELDEQEQLPYSDEDSQRLRNASSYRRLQRSHSPAKQHTNFVEEGINV
eukprot:Clim_evm58s201 gene=Clim_evmTU58s201